METENETAVCRGCGRKLIGKPAEMGEPAFMPITLERVPRSYYGGFVCSANCERKVMKSVGGSMPGRGGNTYRMDSLELAAFRRVWGDS